MWAPQFTIRRLLLWTTLAAVLAVVASFARQGHVGARAVIMMVMMLAISFLVYATLFVIASVAGSGLASAVGRLSWRRRPHAELNPESQSPFAEHRPPPQMIRPEDPL
jgi:hypothetical protein